MNKQNKVYIGVYGVYIKDSEVLLIKKGRGPYIGKYDFPGGGLKFEETINDCLSREIQEETGAALKKNDFLFINECILKYEKNGEMIDFHHLAIYYKVDLNIESLKIDPDGEDSLGAVFIPIKDLTKNNLSQIAKPVLTWMRNKYI